jgi:hypothetical protein
MDWGALRGCLRYCTSMCDSLNVGYGSFAGDVWFCTYDKVLAAVGTVVGWVVWAVWLISMPCRVV